MDIKEGALYLHFIPAAISVAFYVDSIATVRTDPAEREWGKSRNSSIDQLCGWKGLILHHPAIK